jgi:hypothetical protein
MSVLAHNEVDIPFVKCCMCSHVLHTDSLAWPNEAGGFSAEGL